MANNLHQQSPVSRWFDGREIRAVWKDGEWWFSTADAVGAFANSENPRQHWSALKKELKKQGVDPMTICDKVKMISANGRRQPLDASNEQMLLRIVQSMSTDRVEHIRQWLAEVGAERLREEREPERITERAIETHRRRYGMTESEAAQAVQATAARKQLTGVWKELGIQGKQYAALTSVGHEATFDVSVAEHRSVKGLAPKENVRPHMTGVERALTMLQETTEEEIIRTKGLRGFYPIRNAAQSSGAIAARARKSIEQHTGEPVVSTFNRKRKALPST